MTDDNDGRLAFGFTIAGLVAAVGGFVVLWRMPVYGSGETLAEVNGSYVLGLAAAPAVVALIAWIGLHARCSRGSTLGYVVAWIVVGLLGLLTFAGMFSIGMFLLPAAGLLFCAVVTTPRGGVASA